MSMNRNAPLATFLLAALLFCAMLPAQVGCGGGGGGEYPLVLAATSDLEDTGILQAWASDFQSRSGLRVELVFAADQEVAKMAEHGECDLLVMHLTTDEERLVRSNYVEGRSEIMRDRFVVAGPAMDPAGVRGLQSGPEALRKIAESKAPFVSREDGSGTSYKEALLWSTSGVRDTGDWLMKSNAGMRDALRQASQKGAYILCDLSNFEAVSEELDLEVLVDGGEELLNPYRAMRVSGLVYPDTDAEGAGRFMEYMLSEKARGFFRLGAWEPPPEQ